MYEYRASVTRVIDGDTLVVRVDLGFEVDIRRTLRLRRVNCSELKTLEGKAAREFVIKELSQDGARGFGDVPVVVRTFQDKTEKYGRYLAEVHYQKAQGDGTSLQVNLNDELLRTGHAVPF